MTMSIHYHDIGGLFFISDSRKFYIDPHFDGNFRFCRLCLVRTPEKSKGLLHFCFHSYVKCVD